MVTAETIDLRRWSSTTFDSILGTLLGTLFLFVVDSQLFVFTSSSALCFLFSDEGICGSLTLPFD